MDNMNQTQTDFPKEQDAEGRREALRKLGKYAAYAAPFTLLASNLQATGGGAGSGGGPKAVPGPAGKR